MSHSHPPFPQDRVLVVPWVFEEPDGVSHDARSPYVEQFWLGVLGPSTTILLRYLSAELEASPAGFVLHYDELATQLGLTGRGRHSPFMRTLYRLCRFDMARLTPSGHLAVRRGVPSLGDRQLARLPVGLQQRHSFVLKKLQAV